MKYPRIAIAALTLSAAGFAGLVLQEGFTPTAVIPTQGDRPTIGFGSTFREDGSPVKMGDTITPPRAVARSQAHIAKDEVGLKRCMEGAELSQIEYDVLVDFAYQYGVTTTCASSMARHSLAGEYEAACNAYLEYRKIRIQRVPTVVWFDCSTPGNRICSGVWTRQLERQAKCLAAQ